MCIDNFFYALFWRALRNNICNISKQIIKKLKKYSKFYWFLRVNCIHYKQDVYKMYLKCEKGYKSIGYFLIRRRKYGT